MVQKDNCPHCGVSLIGKPIPKPALESGGYGSATHYRRELGVKIQGAFDGVLFWQCPDCGGRWHRFDRTSRQYVTADKFIKGEQHA